MDTVHTITTLGPGRAPARVVPAKLGTMAPVGVFFEERATADERFAAMRNQWSDLTADVGDSVLPTIADVARVRSAARRARSE